MVDVIVIGGGHAGVEAALACARLQKKTILYTLHIDMIASMPCNPSIGGPAKGVVVREIDALGGEMGKAADATALQFKMLNTTKGPGVQALRVQSDKIKYKEYMRNVVLNQDNLEVREMMIEELLVKDHKIEGVLQQDGKNQRCHSLILTTGTFMSGTILVGHTAIASGPDQEPTTMKLSESLRAQGIETFRLKTGTPARVKTASIDFSKTEIQPGTDAFIHFSNTTTQIRPFQEQLPCYLTYTTSKTHEIIHANLEKSAMYSGLVKGVGPRYCPSIEDKLVRFANKERHQIFLEPESEQLDTTYVQGFSTSMPEDVQLEMLHSLPGLEHCIVDKFGYAMEYDAVDPLQCKATLENMIVENLYTAGQINGTSGYEEAAGQGLIAGINCVLKMNHQEPFILRRDEAYIGVMIDDLVTKGTKEPYRLLTSRAEYRLLLRHDNSDIRLMEYGYQIGLIHVDRYQQFKDKMQAIINTKKELENIHFNGNSPINQRLIELGYDSLQEGLQALVLLKRPNITFADIQPYLNMVVKEEVGKQIEIDVKYEGYIKKAEREAHRMHQMEKIMIPENVDYQALKNLSLEARQKLSQVVPHTIGQASRISGVSPADISVLLIYLQQKNK